MTVKLDEIVETGPQTGALRILLYGPEGVGKTTLASLFPQTVILDLEGGSDTYDVQRINPRNLGEYHAVINALTFEQHNYRTVVVDTISKLESWLEKKILAEKKKSRIADFNFGDGWILVREEFEDELSSLDQLARTGINVILVGHSIIKREQPPELTEGYDTHKLAVTEKAAVVIRRWAKAIFFMSFETRVGTNKAQKTFGLGDSTKRIIHTERSAAWDAKNRFGLPTEIAFSSRDELPEELNPLFAWTPAILDEAMLADFKNAVGLIPHEALLGFLVHRGEIKLGEGLNRLRPEFIGLVIKEPERFAEVVTNFWAEKNGAPAEGKNE